MPVVCPRDLHKAFILLIITYEMVRGGFAINENVLQVKIKDLGGK